MNHFAESVDMLIPEEAEGEVLANECCDYVKQIIHE